MVQTGYGIIDVPNPSRDVRIQRLADKFAARHGQKGVLGILAKLEDLPYTAQGITPDVLINPHAFPSRMTVGMFMESITGKAAALRGTQFDGSAFVGEKMEEKIMDETGFKYSGKEVMYVWKDWKTVPSRGVYRSCILPKTPSHGF